MEVVDNQEQEACKFRKTQNGRNDSYRDEEQEENREPKRLINGPEIPNLSDTNRLSNRSGWNNSSRIIRVSRASGGKDRHSKVWTSKGLRDRRVRLSVGTAIQFYDLQDRLGYDQPSKAVDWLIKAAEEAISELPSLNSSNFPNTPKRNSEHGFDSAEMELDGEVPNSNNYQQNQTQNFSLSKSACSSTSETSKGSGLSLSQSEIKVNRVKARERARERAAKEKENPQNPNISHNPSFTELLTTGIGNVRNHNNTSPASSSAVSARQNQSEEPSNLFHNYFTSSGILGRAAHQNSGFSHAQIQLGNSHSIQQTMSIPVSSFNVSGEGHAELQHLSFVPDHHLIPSGGSDYNLNFTIASGLNAGFNRGTLQSNVSSPSHLPHFQRFNPAADGSNHLPFFIGAAIPPMENHHHHLQFSTALDGRLQLCYPADSSRPHMDQKGKGKH